MPATSTVSFDEIIQASRQKKQHEDLANQILGKNRRASAPGSNKAGKAQNATPGGSLASRIGVTKRSSSANLGSKPNSRASSATAAGRNTSNAKLTRRRRPDEERLASALNPAKGQATVRSTGGGINIKGASSAPPVVTGSNFVPGTTAADIQSAIEPVSGKIVSCWITSQKPAVTAEITFAELSSAEKAVANFHNQMADGRVLSFRLSSGATTNRNASSRPTTNSFDNQREQADRQRRSRQAADPALQDGRYGFDEQNNQPLDSSSNGRGNGRRNRGRRNQGKTANQGAQETGLYSDEMMVDAPPTGPRGRGNRR
ncbi:RNA recognition motif domain-containing protein [Aspergillus stella-maris]|uniref:RNA recognition motif domain-containing protein n=1 Tax=Aspergillus stella-maris TaxID=1810926 RepID=UPI003CCDB023